METLYLIDASGYLYRSYHAIQGMTNASGESTNALFGFIRSLMKLIKDFHPEHMVAVFDGPRSLAKREALYKEYKAHRVAMPLDLRYQVDWAHQFCELQGIPQLAVEGVEADDTMGSVAKWAEKRNALVYLCSSDKDMAQLVSDHVRILNTFKENQVIGPKEVMEIYGVKPEQMIDWLAITGDTSDHVPGLPGFGPKTATALLQQYGTLEQLLTHPERLSGKKKEVVERGAEQARLSRQLVTIDTGVPFPQDRSFFQMRPSNRQGLKEFYTRMNFNSLLRELGDVSSSAATVESCVYQLVDDELSLQAMVAELSKYKEICIGLVSTESRPLQSELVGMGFGVSQTVAWYVPVNGALGLQKVIQGLRPLLENHNHRYFGHDLKFDLHLLESAHIHLAPLSFDTILASYVLSSHQRRHSLDDLSLEIFDKHKISLEQLIGKGKKQISLQQVPVDKMRLYCCEDIDYTIRLKEHLCQQLNERKLWPVLQNIELPLVPVLAEMERKGIFVDATLLEEMGSQVARQIKVLEEQVFDLVGERFNMNSPRQLSEILFTKLKIKPPRKTATGHSTSADILEGLQENYPVAGKMLAYRSLEKLRSTYLEALPHEINLRTGRIHPTFNQSVAATGRLACQDPNLQNIPVRTVEGRKIRGAFRPQLPGWKFLAADYSQIELRLLAHLSEDPALLHAFQNNEDIHAHTAATVFGIPLHQVTYEQRQQAKAVNFGVIYGQQAFGLGRELGIDMKAAAAFIDLYFKRYPKVRAFVDGAIEKARASHRAVTLTGRERLIPEIHSPNGALRTAAERLAVNTPLQGSAADLIKLAMIAVDKRLRKEGLRGYMILQIHDELLFEVPDEEIEPMTSLVRESMQGAMRLRTPLLVDIKVGRNWAEC